MSRNRWFPMIAITGVAMLVAARPWAFPEFARQSKASCVTCHANPAGGDVLTEAGKAFKADGKAPAAASAKAAEYVGSNKCKMCHSPQFKGWATTPHAKALANLQTADPAKAAEVAERLKLEIQGTPAGTDACVVCHVTGFQLAGGYPAADSAKTAAVSGVTCESCHGPGSLHMTAAKEEKKNFIRKNVTEKMCRQCHTPESSPNFNFEEYVKKGVHPPVKAGG